MKTRINIVGAGISGLLTAYYLQKILINKDLVSIEIYDSLDESGENASTNSLAWLNTIYPSKDQKPEAYDQFRIASIANWITLDEDLKKDGISQLFSTGLHHIEINQNKINSLYIFFNENQENDFVNIASRLQQHTDQFQPQKISPFDLSPHFPFINQLPKDITIRNMSNEHLINFKKLRNQLIPFLKKSGIIFHWKHPVSPDMIQSQPHTEWILAAGNGCIPLINQTTLENIKFSEQNLADVIHCTLEQPLDLMGKVFHFEASNMTPAFHLRNDENDINKLKIIVTRQAGKSLDLELTAQSIFKLLQVNAIECTCNDKVERPITPDSKPLIETKLGGNENIHIVYGHSLFTNGAKLFAHFVNNLAITFNENSQFLLFNVLNSSSDLTQFSSNERFLQVKPAAQYSYRSPAALALARFSVFRDKSSGQENLVTETEVVELNPTKIPPIETKLTPS